MAILSDGFTELVMVCTGYHFSKSQTREFNYDFEVKYHHQPILLTPDKAPFDCEIWDISIAEMMFHTLRTKQRGYTDDLFNGGFELIIQTIDNKENIYDVVMEFGYRHFGGVDSSLKINLAWQFTHLQVEQFAQQLKIEEYQAIRNYAVYNLKIAKQEYDIIYAILRKHIPHCAVWAFGKRLGVSVSHGRIIPDWDVDLAIMGDAPVSQQELDGLIHDFAHSSLAWKVNLVDFNLADQSIRSDIDRKRCEIFNIQRMIDDV